MGRKRHRGLAFLAAAGGLTLLLGRTNRLTTVTYPVKTGKLAHPLRLALVTDLHSCRYGTDQRELLDAIARQAPDALLLGGDILDDHLPRAPGDQFVTQAARRWPTFYVTGNHEYRTGEIDSIKRFLTQAGVTVLAGDCVSFSAKGQTIQLCGTDDPEGIGQAAMNAHLARETTRVPRLFNPPELVIISLT